LVCPPSDARRRRRRLWMRRRLRVMWCQARGAKPHAGSRPRECVRKAAAACAPRAHRPRQIPVAALSRAVLGDRATAGSACTIAGRTVAASRLAARRLPSLPAARTKKHRCGRIAGQPKMRLDACDTTVAAASRAPPCRPISRNLPMGIRPDRRRGTMDIDESNCEECLLHRVVNIGLVDTDSTWLHADRLGQVFQFPQQCRGSPRPYVIRTNEGGAWGRFRFR